MRDRPTMEGELALRGPIPFGTIALFGCAIVVTMTSAPLALIALLAGLEPGSIRPGLNRGRRIGTPSWRLTSLRRSFASPQFNPMCSKSG